MAEKQTVDNQYINRADLVKLLKQLFGDDYKIKEREDDFLITVPRRLTDCLSRRARTDFPSKSKMDQLQIAIQQLRRKNYQSRYFVPRKALLKLLQREAVVAALKDKIPPRYLGDVTDSIYRNGLLTFAILVVINRVEDITKLIEQDQLQRGQLDYKLPYDEGYLQGIIGEFHGEQFVERQWEFVAPVFSPFVVQRRLADDTILPFIKERPIARGSFGQVYHVTIDAEHQEWDNPSTEVVRKEILGTEGSSQGELEAMSTLNLLSHPNVTRLLGFYIHRDVPNFLFPKASGGSLKELLSGPRLDPFQVDSTFFVALAGLASAVSAVHTFAIRDLDLSLIGCHHDIKAKNILVERDQFILADFGLAMFKDQDQGSSTNYKLRNGFEIAPECQDLSGNYDTHRVRRSSDIWSLGCVMLNVMTYMKKGSAGVDEFEEKREFQVDGVEYSLYHAGKQASPAIGEWISHLREKSTGADIILLRLVEKMLHMDPGQRPQASEVASEAMRAALFAHSQSLFKLLDDLCQKNMINEASIDPMVERTRFDSWMSSIGLNTASTEAGSQDYFSTLDISKFSAVTTTLETLRHQIIEAIAVMGFSHSRVLLPIRHSITALHSFLPLVFMKKAQSLSEIQLLHTSNLSRLGRGDGAIPSRDLQNVASLARSKDGVLNSEHCSSPGIVYPLNPVSDVTSQGYHWVGRAQSPDGEPIQVLVDYKNYEDVVQRERLSSRIAQIAKMSQAVENCENAGILRCRGFYHDQDRSAYGLVYDLPRGEDGTSGGPYQPLSLQEILEPPEPPSEGQRSVPSSRVRLTPPPLRRRFALAWSLAKSVSELHKLGWAHKNLSAAAVTFFPDASGREAWYFRPYLTGFRHSRQNDKNVFTEGPALDEHSKYYQHPEYSSENKRYCLPYDYYSLGIILLQIGLWRPIKKLAFFPGLSAEQCKQKLLNDRIPLLACSMGQVYETVVSVCLTFPSQTQDSDEALKLYKIEFEEKVLSRLSRLASLEI